MPFAHYGGFLSALKSNGGRLLPSLLEAPIDRIRRAINLPPRPSPNGAVWVSRLEPASFITLTTTNTAPERVLDDLVINYGLEWELDSATGVHHLKLAGPSLEEIMKRLTRDDAPLRQLEEAIRRPHAQLQWSAEDPLGELPNINFMLLRSACQGLATRSKIHILQGAPEAALHDLNLMKRIADFAASKPSLVGAMIKVASEGLVGECVQEGLGAGLWPPTQLAALQNELASVDLLTPWITGMHYERAVALEAIRRMTNPGKYVNARADFFRMFNDHNYGFPPAPTLADAFFESVLKATPRGWFYQNMAQLADAPDLTASCDAARRRVDSSQAEAYHHQMDEWVKSFSPYRMLALNAFPNFIVALGTATKNQTLLNEAFVACLLERHRAAKGTYPAKLDALVPEFAAKLPPDLFDGQPLRYRRTHDGKYLLYSIGWNGKDDGGSPVLDAKGNPTEWSMDHRDWIWRGVPKK